MVGQRGRRRRRQRVGGQLGRRHGRGRLQQTTQNRTRKGIQVTRRRDEELIPRGEDGFNCDTKTRLKLN